MLKLLQHGLHPHWELDVRGAELDAQVLPLAALEREPGVVRGPGPWAPEDRDAAWWNALPLEEWLPPEAECLGSERWAGAGAGGCAGSRQARRDVRGSPHPAQSPRHGARHVAWPAQALRSQESHGRDRGAARPTTLCCFGGCRWISPGSLPCIRKSSIPLLGRPCPPPRWPWEFRGGRGASFEEYVAARRADAGSQLRRLAHVDAACDLMNKLESLEVGAALRLCARFVLWDEATAEERLWKGGAMVCRTSPPVEQGVHASGSWAGPPSARTGRQASALVHLASPAAASCSFACPTCWQQGGWLGKAPSAGNR